MEEITIQRIPFTKEADMKLRVLKGKTGITPNILCRLGFCMSLENYNEPESIFDKEKGKEINRFTLLGQYDICFKSLLITWKFKNSSIQTLDELLVRHMNRGALMINQYNFI